MARINVAAAALLVELCKKIAERMLPVNLVCTG